jgi:hypothetical protein
MWGRRAGRDKDGADSADQWLTMLDGLGYRGEQAERAAQAAYEAQIKGMSRAQAADVALALAQGKRGVRVGRPLWERLIRDRAVVGLVLGLVMVPLSLRVISAGLAFCALVGMCLAVSGMRSPTRLGVPALAVNLLVFAFQFTPQL